MSGYPPNAQFRAAFAAAAAIAVLALAGCGSSGGSNSSQPAGHSTSPASGQSSSPASGSTSVASASVPFPIAVGDTWIYKTTTLTGATGKVTDKILAVTPVFSGQRVTMANAIDTLGITTRTHETYVFYTDGSISWPFSQVSSVSSASVKLVSGGLFWPPAAELATGKPYYSKLKIDVSSSGQQLQVTAHITVQGVGSGTVTVPAGSYDATIVSMTMTETIDGYSVGIKVKTWLASGVGPVQSEAILDEAGTSHLVSKQELTSFTKG